MKIKPETTGRSFPYTWITFAEATLGKGATGQFQHETQKLSDLQKEDAHDAQTEALILEAQKDVGMTADQIAAAKMLGDATPSECAGDLKMVRERRRIRALAITEQRNRQEREKEAVDRRIREKLVGEHRQRASAVFEALKILRDALRAEKQWRSDLDDNWVAWGGPLKSASISYLSADGADRFDYWLKGFDGVGGYKLP